jgi:hypothetical protein
VTGVFSPRVILGWIAAVAATFALSLYLMSLGDADAPDVVGPSAFSRSAIGYAGLAELLQRLGLRVEKSRSSGGATIGADSLLIVAEPPVAAKAVERKLIPPDVASVLVILPKWFGRRSRTHEGWIEETTQLPPANVDWVIEAAGAKGKTIRVDAPRTWTTNQFGAKPQVGDTVQLIADSDLRPLVASAQGILIGERRTGSKRIWLIADPDILSNHGLLKGDNPALAARLFTMLLPPPPRGRIVFDETLHGYSGSTARSPRGLASANNPLRLLFQFPLVMVTLQVVAALGLVLWATMVRFGKPEPMETLFAQGKGGLIRNAAHLMEFAGGRETLLSDYFRATVRGVARRLRAPASLGEPALIDWLGRVGRAHGVAADLPAIARRVDEAVRDHGRSTPTLVAAARDIHRWKQEMLDAH